MDLSDRLVEHDHWHTARLLEHAATLSDADLDRPVRPGFVVHEFEGTEPDVRSMLEHKEVWTAAIGGSEIPRATNAASRRCRRGWRRCSRGSRRWWFAARR